jgi:hypothetical protein
MSVTDTRGWSVSADSALDLLDPSYRLLREPKGIIWFDFFASMRLYVWCFHSGLRGKDILPSGELRYVMLGRVAALHCSGSLLR